MPYLTKDELQWLEAVTLPGAELTRIMMNIQSNEDVERIVGKLTTDKDWVEIQYPIYIKVTRLVYPKTKRPAFTTK